MGTAACWLVVAFGVAAMPRAARAQPGTAQAVEPTQTARPAEEGTRWYGWQILLADAGVAAVALGVQRTEPLVALGLTGMVVHAGHGRYDASALSVVMRLTFPALGGFLGAATCREDPSGESLDCLGPIALGVGLGGAAALAVDYFFLGREAIGPASTGIAPVVLVTPAATTAGLSLAF